MNYSTYYLDLEKVTKLESESDRDKIHQYYTDMLHASFDKREELAKSLFNTLYSADYLKEVRDEKLQKILS